MLVTSEEGCAATESPEGCVLIQLSSTLDRCRKRHPPNSREVYISDGCLPASFLPDGNGCHPHCLCGQTRYAQATFHLLLFAH